MISGGNPHSLWSLASRLHCSDVLIPSQVLGELARLLTRKAKRTPSQTRDSILRLGGYI